MVAALPLFICSLIFHAYKIVGSVPPEACFQNFRWEDCGGSPEPVMYYWKPGSRCEVGIWRGCLPNLNMFKDEYDCVSTCIFASRAMPENYHAQNNILGDDYGNDTLYETNTEDHVTNTANISDSDSTGGGDATKGDVTEGDITEGDITKGDVTKGDVTKGDVTEGDVTEGGATEGDATKSAATDSGDSATTAADVPTEAAVTDNAA